MSSRIKATGIVGSMLAAALVLALSDRTKLRAATIQGFAPLLAVVFLGIGLAV